MQYYAICRYGILSKRQYMIYILYSGLHHISYNCGVSLNNGYQLCRSGPKEFSEKLKFKDQKK